MNLLRALTKRENVKKRVEKISEIKNTLEGICSRLEDTEKVDQSGRRGNRKHPS